jgi:catechol 2,3-dioxygenase-like lactoylglutathione lyase family enzyme
MLRKIDCVMIRVEDVDVSAAYYAKVFGLRPKWSGEGRLVSFLLSPMLKLCFTARRLFPHQLKSITKSMMSLSP